MTTLLILLILFAALYMVGGLICPIGYANIVRNRKHIITFILGIVLVVSGIIGIFCCTYGLTKVPIANTIDTKIARYQERNDILESEILQTFNEHLEHSGEVFTELTPEAVGNGLNLCPELQSDRILMAKINEYFANSIKIKEPDTQKIRSLIRSMVNWFQKIMSYPSL